MPNFYNNPYQQYYSQPQMQQPAMQSQVQQPQIQNGGFVPVRGESEARNYPVAPGNSVTFKDETAPYVYTKTMGFSQLDRPIFEKYRLVKEEPTMPENDVKDSEGYKLSYEELKSEIEAIKAQIEALKERVDAMNEKPKAKSKKEMAEDE